MTRILALLLLLLPAAASARAPQGADVTTQPEYYTSTNAEGLDSLAFLPPPPETDSIAFLLDQARYQDGLAKRNGPAGKQAREDAIALKLHETFSQPFGVEISEKGTPAIYNLLYSIAGELGDMATRSAKQGYFRPRPYVVHNDPTCYPEEEEILRNNGSYPSGHSARGWGLALLLAEINPDNKEAILKRGYDSGQSRVICGYHWQSDVDAGRLAGAAAIAALHANPLFQERLKKAIEEFAGLKKAGKVTIH